MSDFWAKKLGVPAQAPAAPAPLQSNQPWWALPAVQQPVQQPVQAPTQQQQPTPGGQSNIIDLLQQEHYTTTKAKSNTGGRCPECSSGNWLPLRGDSKPGTPYRCYDCGFNEMGYQHSTAGMSSTQDNLPVHAARVQVGTKSNFDPTVIIGRV